MGISGRRTETVPGGKLTRGKVWNRRVIRPRLLRVSITVRPRRCICGYRGDVMSITGRSPELREGMSGESGQSQVSSLSRCACTDGNSHWMTCLTSREGMPGSSTRQMAVVTILFGYSDRLSSTPQASGAARWSEACTARLPGKASVRK